MKIENKLIKILLIIFSSVVGFTILIVLFLWTKSLEAKKRQDDLRKAMREVIDVYGEKGLLEMAGIPVNDIFYGDEGLTLFTGDNATWKCESI